MKADDSGLPKQKALFFRKKRSVIGVLEVVLLFSSIFTIGGFFSRYKWYFDILSHFRFHYFVFFFLLSFLCLIVRKWKTLLFSVLLCLINLMQIIPLYIPYSTSEAVSSDNSAAIKIVHFNVLSSNGEYKNAIKYIDEKNADIVVLNEVNKAWVDNLALDQEYKYSVVETREDNFGIALYSKIELKNPRIEYFGDKDLPSAAAEVKVGEKEVSILGTHPLPPINDLNFKARNAQFEAIIRNKDSFSKSLVLLGDLNTTSWSYGFKNLVEGMQLYDSRRGYGIQFSWPTTMPILSIPIDHCLVSKDIKVLKREMGPNIGSDHRPIYIELGMANMLKVGNKNGDEYAAPTDSVKDINSTPEETAQKPEAKSIIKPGGMTIKERFDVPEGFERVQVTEGSYAEYLRNLPLKPHGSVVHYFDGSEKVRDVYDAVIDVDVGERDLQQCADAVMRLRAEYLYGKGLYDKIHFNFTNGFRADYTKWMNGNRIVVKGNNTYWVKNAGYSKEYKVFRQYMDMVFAYAGTLSLSNEMDKVNISDMEIGDIFIKGASPGHCVIIVDMAVNNSSGEKIFMIAQGYMPAQDIQVLKNYNNSEISPWYSSDFGEVLETPEWTFYKDQLMRFGE